MTVNKTMSESEVSGYVTSMISDGGNTHPQLAQSNSSFKLPKNDSMDKERLSK